MGVDGDGIAAGTVGPLFWPSELGSMFTVSFMLFIGCSLDMLGDASSILGDGTESF